MLSYSQVLYVQLPIPVFVESEAAKVICPVKIVQSEMQDLS